MPVNKTPRLLNYHRNILLFNTRIDTLIYSISLLTHSDNRWLSVQNNKNEYVKCRQVRF